MKLGQDISYVGLVLVVCLQIVECKVFLEWGQVEPKTTPFIVRAEKVEKLGEYPWHVAIFHKESYRSGGSIISDQFVLTATHTTYDENRQINPSSLTVKAGIINTSAIDSKDYTVTEIIRYPGYDVNTLVHDICLLKLNKQIEFNKFIRPVKLWDNTDTLMSSLGSGNYFEVVLGFGLTEKRTASTDLRRARYYPVSPIECASIESFKPALEQNSAYCAKGGENATICTGDSGGGSVYYDNKNETYYLRGVVSRGFWMGETCVSNRAGLFTNVVRYIKWIEKIAVPTMYNLVGNADCKGVSSSQQSTLTLPALAHLKYAFRKTFSVSDCHGLLITRKHVLTQANCIANNTVRKLHAVALGSSAVNDPLEPSRQYGIQSIKNEQELAIITLAEEVDESIEPVCIPTRPEEGEQSILFWEQKAKHPKFIQQRDIMQLNEKMNSIHDILNIKIKDTAKDRRIGSAPLMYTVTEGTEKHAYLRALEKCSTHTCETGTFIDVLMYRQWIKNITNGYIDDSIVMPPLPERKKISTA